jgi:hypothetical protein
MADAPEPEQPKRKRERSPSYPGISLETALERAQRLYDVERRNAAPAENILKHWGYAPKSGGGMVALAALKKFGLVTDEGTGSRRQARLTDLALRILQDRRPGSEERAQAIKDAALAPGIHRELWERYREGGLPSDETMEFYLVTDRGFTESGAKELIQEFRNTLAFARLDGGGTLPDSEGDTSQNGSTEMNEGEGGGTALLERERYKGQAKMVQLPLASGKWATLQAPFPFTEQDWDLMLAVLQAMKPGLVSEPQEESSEHTSESY